MIRLFAAILLIIGSRGMATGQVVYVSTATQLQAALNAALPGQTIQMADGTYTATSGFSIPKNINGTSAQPITLIGSRNAILTTGDSSKSNSLWLKGNRYWVVKDFTVRKSKKGIMMDSSFYNTIDNILVKKIGEEAIHIRTYSSYNIVQNCSIDSTGLHTRDYGEGIYVGSAVSNWPTYTAGNIDTCNYNKMLNNQFGSAITAENIDIKEGTTGGEISGNSFNGAGLTNTHFADSWVDLKGNNYLVENNTGHTTYTDAFQTHINYPGYGNYNTFSNNIMTIPGAPGYGIRIQTSGSNGTASNNKVCSNNLQTGASMGLTNVSVSNCPGPLASSLLLFFRGAFTNDHVLLQWRVSAFTDISHYEIENSMDGAVFTLVRKIQPSGLDYSEKIFSVQGVFRLKVILLNGTFYYSDVIRQQAAKEEIKIYMQQTQLNIFNPFSHNLFYKVADMNGRIIKVGMLPSGNSIISLQGASTGLHVIQIRNEKRQSDTLKKIFL